MKKRIELLRLLSDNRFHSGEHLGAELGISRTAVWKHMQALQAMGIDCYSVSGKGYRLAQPIELLCATQIQDGISELNRGLLSGLELHHQIQSTNAHLMERRRHLGRGHACLAESQTHGRGRRGREWVSPFAKNIYLSLYWQFDISPTVLSGLGLAVGVGLLRALRALGVEEASLKWPNDILWQGQKLAGILLEMNAEMGGPYHVVIGVGMNVNMDQNSAEIDQPWAALNQVFNQPVSRNRVAGSVIDALLSAVSEFERFGLEPFIAEWSEADAYANRPIVIRQADGDVHGLSKGIDREGAILVETEQGVQRYHSGDVSLRPLVDAP